MTTALLLHYNGHEIKSCQNLLLIIVAENSTRFNLIWDKIIVSLELCRNILESSEFTFVRRHRNSVSTTPNWKGPHVSPLIFQKLNNTVYSEETVSIFVTFLVSNCNIHNNSLVLSKDVFNFLVRLLCPCRDFHCKHDSL